MKQWTETVTWTEITDDAATWPPADADVLFVSERGVLRGCRLWHSPMCRMESGGRFSISYFSRWAPLPTGREPEPTPPMDELEARRTAEDDQIIAEIGRMTMSGRGSEVTATTALADALEPCLNIDRFIAEYGSDIARLMDDRDGIRLLLMYAKLGRNVFARRWEQTEPTP